MVSIKLFYQIQPTKQKSPASAGLHVQKEHEVLTENRISIRKRKAKLGCTRLAVLKIKDVYKKQRERNKAVLQSKFALSKRKSVLQHLVAQINLNAKLRQVRPSVNSEQRSAPSKGDNHKKQKSPASAGLHVQKEYEVLTENRIRIRKRKAKRSEAWLR